MIRSQATRARYNVPERKSFDDTSSLGVLVACWGCFLTLGSFKLDGFMLAACPIWASGLQSRGMQLLILWLSVHEPVKDRRGTAIGEEFATKTEAKDGVVVGGRNVDVLGALRYSLLTATGSFSFKLCFC